jgi:hypothetical protein
VKIHSLNSITLKDIGVNKRFWLQSKPSTNGTSGELVSFCKRITAHSPHLLFQHCLSISLFLSISLPFSLAEPYDNVMKTLLRLSEKRTVPKKLRCLIEASRAIVAAVQEDRDQQQRWHKLAHSSAPPAFFYSNNPIATDSVTVAHRSASDDVLRRTPITTSSNSTMLSASDESTGRNELRQTLRGDDAILSSAIELQQLEESEKQQKEQQPAEQEREQQQQQQQQQQSTPMKSKQSNPSHTSFKFNPRLSMDTLAMVKKERSFIEKWS